MDPESMRGDVRDDRRGVEPVAPRIGFLWHGDRNIGGGEHATLWLARLLQPEYVPVLIYAHDNHLLERYAQAGIELAKVRIDRRLTNVYHAAVGLRPIQWGRWSWLGMQAIANVKRTLHERRIDLLHPVDNLSKFIGGIAGRLAGIKVVGHCHDDYGETAVEQILIRQQLFLLDRVIATSDSVSKRLIAEGGEQKVVTVYNGVDTRVFRPEAVEPAPDVDCGWTRGRVVIGVVAMFDRVKGHVQLLRALTKLLTSGDTQWCCLLVGEGREEDLLKREVKLCGLSDHVRFLGYRQDVASVLKHVDIAVVPSERESFGLAAAEAMSMRIPVVATDIGGLREVVEDGVTGLLVRVGDADAMAGALRLLIHDKERRAMMGAQGRERIKNRFNLRANVSRIKSVYNDLLRRRLWPKREAGAGRAGERGDNACPGVSIVIPTFNRCHTLQTVLPSYLRQRNLHEVIVVVDGSTDGTAAWLQSIVRDEPRLRVKILAKQVGVSAARNHGIREATGEYTLFGEDDLYLNDDYASTLLEHLLAADADIIGGRIIYQAEHEAAAAAVSRCDTAFGARRLLNPFLMSVCYQKQLDDDVFVPTLHAIALGRTEIFQQGLLFDETFRYREETELYLRAGERGLKIVLCPHTRCFHLPRDRTKGGGWSQHLLSHHLAVMESNKRLLRRYYPVLRAWGMRGNVYTFMTLHAMNRLRLLYLYLSPVITTGAVRAEGTNRG